jgi:hypothetical protein
MELKARNIETKVSSKLGLSKTESDGRNTVNDRYHLDEGKVVWGYKDGELTQFDPYTDVPNFLLWLDHFLTEQQHNVCP